MAYTHNKKLYVTDYEKELMQKFIRNNMNYNIQITELSGKMTEKQWVYYWRYLLPTVQSIYYKNGEYLMLDQIDEILRSESPICVDMKQAKIKTFDALDIHETSLYFDWCNIYIAENFNHRLQQFNGVPKK